MAYTVTPYVFEPPGPSFSLTLSEKAAWPKIWESTANLDDYPDRHEVLGLEFYIDHRLYEGHGTHWNAKYYNIATDRLLFESDFDIPEPSTKGYTSWSWYRIFSWIGHCSWEINEPMNIQVNVTITSNIRPPIGYIKNFMVTTTAPEPDVCTWDWYAPWNYVTCMISTGLAAMLGLTWSALKTLFGDMYDFFTNSMGAVYDFFADVVGSIVDVIKDNVGDIFDWLSTAFFDFIDWLREIQGDIAGFVTDKISDSLDFLTDQVSGFFTWLGEIGGDVAGFVGDQVSGFVDWSQDQLGSIWTGIETFFTEAISGFVEAFFGGVNTGIEQAKTSPLHSDDPVRNPVLKGLQKVVRKHRKKYGRDIITGEKKHGTV